MASVKKAVRAEMPAAEHESFNPDYISFFENLYDRWIDNLFELSDGLSRFAQSRIHRDIAAWAKLASCRDPKELADCQKYIGEEMTTRFADDVLTVSQMIATIAGNNTRHAQENRGNGS